MSENDKQIMELELPIPEAADLATKAAQEGVTTREYLGIQALAGAYGQMHPSVVAFRKRAKPGQSRPKTGAGE